MPRRARAKKNNTLAVAQYVILWVGLFVILAAFVFLFRADFKVPQREVVLQIDIKNKVNICLPEKSDKLQDDSIF